jgi:hypothetical protein
MENKLTSYEVQIFELSFKEGLIKFSRDSGISIYAIQKVRNKFKKLGLKYELWEKQYT